MRHMRIGMAWERHAMAIPDVHNGGPGIQGREHLCCLYKAEQNVCLDCPFMSFIKDNDLQATFFMSCHGSRICFGDSLYSLLALQ